MATLVGWEVRLTKYRAVDKSHNTKAVLGPKCQAMYGWSPIGAR